MRVLKYIFQKLYCFLGFHKMEFTFEKTMFGYGVGKKCIHCGLWHKDAIREKYKNMK